MKQVAFVSACRQFFGFKEGQSLGEFADELKALTHQDRADLIEMFPSVGFEIVVK